MMTTLAKPRAQADEHSDIVYPSAIPFVLVHLACFAAIWTGVTWRPSACVGLYWLRIFAIGAGYHRYFSHRAYATGRVFQFILAFLRRRTAQKSVLWWAAKHRHHHLHSDTEQDVHSPRHTASSTAMSAGFSRAATTRRSGQDRRFRALSRTDVAAPLRAVPAFVLALFCFADRRLAGPGGRLLLEHGAASITPPSASIRWRMSRHAGAM